jgi:hypothetical protein
VSNPNLVELAKEIARAQHHKPTLSENLAKWWEKKYSLPSNHELFQERTSISLLTEYYYDIYESSPLEMHRQADGEIQLKDTGDALIDKWEEQIAEGMEPDLWEAFSDKEREKLKAKLVKKSLASATL